jgi:hypothetical protein
LLEKSSCHIPLLVYIIIQRIYLKCFGCDLEKCILISMKAST